MKRPPGQRAALSTATLVLSLFFLDPAVLAAEQHPWEGPAFSGDPAEILRVGSSLTAPPGADLHILSSEYFIVFDREGKRTDRYRSVFRVLTKAGVERWPEARVYWGPWFEEKPEVQARVITPDGAVHWLDPATIAESPIQEESPLVLSDRRIIRAPLPALTPGAIVEQEISVKERIPYFDGGIVGSFSIGGPIPTLREVATIEAPSSMSLRAVARLLPGVEPRRSEIAGVVRLEFEAGPLDALEPPEPLMPPDVPQRPSVAFSTGASWAAVARRYGAILDERVKDSDLKDVLTETVRGMKKREMLAERLLEYLRRKVRYTGVEFGEAAIIPNSPQEVLQRGYGDCKDRAALLIAMLRACHVQAQIALLSAGVGQDVEPDLPGLGMFNHAIVYLPGDPPLWIDPTNDYSRVGELPTQDQGRLTLVAGPNTINLVRTPEAAAANNLVVETREFFLTESGGARVVETTEATGSSERGFRFSYSRSPSKETRDHLEQYVQEVYLADSLASYENSDPADLSAPFRIRVEAAGARRGSTSPVDAAVAIVVSPIWNRLPSLATSEELEGLDSDGSDSAGASAESNGGGGGGGGGDKKRRRTAPLFLPEPFVTEWRYTIHPPPGYASRQVPEEKTEQLGPARFSREFTVGEGSVVQARLRFETLAKRLSPEDLAALRKGLKTLQESPLLLVTFEQVGEAHLAAGRVREALEEFRKLAALHPAESLHRSQIAMALLAAGLGAAARKEARKSIEIESSSALAHYRLGWILQHDLVGRRFREGFDYEGALAALRKAKELDSKDKRERADLAILLEHDAEGERYTPESKLGEAIAEYKELRQDLDEKAFDVNFMLALAHAGRWDELSEFVRTQPRESRNDSILLLAIAVRQGPAAALQEAARAIADLDKRRAAIKSAGLTLMSLRKYPEAAAFLSEAAGGSPDALKLRGLAEMLRKTKRHEEIQLPDDDPRSVVKKMFITAISSHEFSPEEWRPLFARKAFVHGFEKEDVRSLRSVRRVIGASMESSGVSIRSVVDLALGFLQLTVDGNDSVGYRIRIQQTAGSAPPLKPVIVVSEEGTYRVLSTFPPLAALGEEVLDRQERGDLLGARQLLDWAREETRPAGGDDPLSGPLLPRFWTRGDAGSPDQVRIAAASLLAGGDGGERAISILQKTREQKAREAAGDDATAGDSSAAEVLGAAAAGGPAAAGATKVDIDVALATALMPSHRDQALPLARAFLAARPRSLKAFRMFCTASIATKQWAECEQAAAERMKETPEDPHALRFLATIAMRQGNLDEARKLYRRIIDSGKPESVDLNSLAWNDLVAGNVTDDTVDMARRACQMEDNADYTSLHTLASIYAERGETTEAREAILRGMDVSGSEEPTEADWYVLGRIAEQFGVLDAAIEAYQKVPPPKEDESLVDSVYSLAQRRIAAIESSKAAESPKTSRSSRSLGGPG